MKPIHALAVGALFAAVSLLTACSDGRMPTAGAPHPTDAAWVMPEVAVAQNAQFHGAALGVFNCGNCHEPETFCFRCHFGPAGVRTPNAAVWIHGFAQHWEYKDNAETCNRCHTLHNVTLGFTLRTCATGDCH